MNSASQEMVCEALKAIVRMGASGGGLSVSQLKTVALRLQKLAERLQDAEQKTTPSARTRAGRLGTLQRRTEVSKPARRRINPDHMPIEEWYAPHRE